MAVTSSPRPSRAPSECRNERTASVSESIAVSSRSGRLSGDCARVVEVCTGWIQDPHDGDSIPKALLRDPPDDEVRCPRQWRRDDGVRLSILASRENGWPMPWPTNPPVFMVESRLFLVDCGHVPPFGGEPLKDIEPNRWLWQPINR